MNMVHKDDGYWPCSGVQLKRAKPGDAGIDLACADDFVLLPGHRKLVWTDVRVALPKGHTGLVCPRSGLAVTFGITVLNAPGVVDEGYRGRIGVPLINLGQEEFKAKAGDRIAQMVIVPYAVPSLGWSYYPLEDFMDQYDTVRGEGGFGSTGVKS